MKKRSERQWARVAEVLGVTYNNLMLAIEVVEKEEAEAARAEEKLEEGASTSDSLDSEGLPEDSVPAQTATDDSEMDQAGSAQ